MGGIGPTTPPAEELKNEWGVRERGCPERVLPHNILLPGQVGVNNVRFEGQGPPEETEDRFSTPLIITIVCMASFLLLVAALYGCCHQRLSQRKDQVRIPLP